MAKASPRAGTEVPGLCLWACVRDLNHFPNAPQHGGSALAATRPLQGPAVTPDHWGRIFGNIWPSPGSILARAQFGLSLPLRRASPCPAPCILDVGRPQPRQAGPPGPVLQHPSCRLPPSPSLLPLPTPLSQDSRGLCQGASGQHHTHLGSESVRQCICHPGVAPVSSQVDIWAVA